MPFSRLLVIRRSKQRDCRSKSHPFGQESLTRCAIPTVVIGCLSPIWAQSFVLQAVALPLHPLVRSGWMHETDTTTVNQNTVHLPICQNPLTHVTPHPNPTMTASLPSPAALNNRGIDLMNQGDIQAALANFNQALQRNPHFAPAYNNRAMIHVLMGELEAAVQDYTASLTYNPQDATVYVNRGLAYAALNDSHAAITDYTHALQINPSNAQAYHSRALALLNTHQQAAARVDAQAAASLYLQLGDQSTYEEVQEMLKQL